MRISWRLVARKETPTWLTVKPGDFFQGNVHLGMVVEIWQEVCKPNITPLYHTPLYKIRYYNFKNKTLDVYYFDNLNNMPRPMFVTS